MLLSCFIGANQSYAQELRCNVSVSSSQLTNVNQNIFRTLQADLYEFMNNTQWTIHKFETHERIECSINIQLTKQTSGEYEGVISVQSVRPCFGASYETTILNLQDESFRFAYQEYQSIDFDINSCKDNLTNVLAYYAYVIIGFDYDTFSMNGGSEYFEMARDIVVRSQNLSSTYTGWRAYESDYNRYWLTDNILNKTYAPYRKLLYEYHRTGLDEMSESLESGRANIASTLRNIQKVFRSRSTLYITKIFFDAKSTELVNIFSGSYADEQTQVKKILTECDPSNSSKYEAIGEDNS